MTAASSWSRSRRPEIDASLEVLGVGSDVVVVERGDVLRAKPEPDLGPLRCKNLPVLSRPDVQDWL
jgi:hypothetical protein